MPAAVPYVRAMLVFVDESGDPGFKIEKGSSPVFVLSMAIFDDAACADSASQTIEALRRDLRVKPEWKFNKASDDNKDAFFNGVQGCAFRTRSIVVQKRLIYSRHLRTVKDDFYRFFVRMLMEHDANILRDAKVVIDGSGEAKFRKELGTYLRRNLASGAIRKIGMKDSKSDPLLQLADMAAGCIARSYRDDRTNPERWRNMLARNGQLDNVWDFR